MPRSLPLPPPPAHSTGRPSGGFSPPAARAPGSGPPPLPRTTNAPQMGAGNASVPPTASFVGGLTAIYQGERTPVSKERFIIGRGRQTSDLTIKDPNVSRQHAMIEFQNGVYYMVDLGSTNGVEYHSQRVSRKAIAEGDVFRICDHEVAFTFR